MLCIALALLCSPLAYAQTTPPGRPSLPATPSLNLTMENEHTLKEILLKDSKIKHESDQAELKAGDKVPQSVELHDFPQEIAAKVPQIKAHRFFVAGETIVVVRPQERTVVGLVK
jgi:hypothetical protein